MTEARLAQDTPREVGYREIPSAPRWAFAAPLTRRDLEVALMAACEAVGATELRSPRWSTLVPLLHELAAELSQDPASGWPDSPAVACRRLAVAVRDWRRRPDTSEVDGEAVVALSTLIELHARPSELDDHPGASSLR